MKASFFPGFIRLPKDPNGFTYERHGEDWWVFGPGFFKWVLLREHVTDQLINKIILKRKSQ